MSLNLQEPLGPIQAYEWMALAWVILSVSLFTIYIRHIVLIEAKHFLLLTIVPLHVGVCTYVACGCSLNGVRLLWYGEMEGRRR